MISSATPWNLSLYFFLLSLIHFPPFTVNRPLAFLLTLWTNMKKEKSMCQWWNAIVAPKRLHFHMKYTRFHSDTIHQHRHTRCVYVDRNRSFITMKCKWKKSIDRLSKTSIKTFKCLCWIDEWTKNRHRNMFKSRERETRQTIGEKKYKFRETAISADTIIF